MAKKNNSEGSTMKPFKWSVEAGATYVGHDGIERKDDRKPVEWTRRKIGDVNQIGKQAGYSIQLPRNDSGVS